MNIKSIHDEPWIWQLPGCRFDLSRRVLVMGILNVTPDSFSDGGRYVNPDTAVRQGLELARLGADIVDIGGESTRPGSDPVSISDELARVLPVIERLAPQLQVPISIDTSKAEVARQALAAGARVVNDVSALLGDPAMARVVSEAQAGLVLMHMLGTPRTMQRDPVYGDVVAEVACFLRERLQAAESAGIPRERILLDPGIGFGKTHDHNIALFRRMGELARLGRPLLVGPSRKAFLGRLLEDAPPAERLEGTAAAACAAILAGARVVRVHDVAPLARVARVAVALAPWQESG